MDKNYRTAFHWACIDGYIEIMKLLMSRDDLNINTQDINGKTPFHAVCGDIEIVKLLMSRDDLNINTQDIGGQTAFHLACKRGDIEIMKLLMSRDELNINIQDLWVRNAEMRWNLSTNNFIFRARVHFITLAREEILK